MKTHVTVTVPTCTSGPAGDLVAAGAPHRVIFLKPHLLSFRLGRGGGGDECSPRLKGWGAPGHLWEMLLQARN